MEKLNLLKIQHYCINDGPGIRTTVFFKGCPLKCRWCHNPESISPLSKIMYNGNLCINCGLCAAKCPNSVHVIKNNNHLLDYNYCKGCGECLKVCVPEALCLWGRNSTAKEVMGEIVKDIDYYNNSSGGVTFSGGEPLQQPEAVKALSDLCHDNNINVYLDTSGYASEKVFSDVAAVVDGFLFDIKLIDPAKHKEYTGVDNAKIISNFRLAANSKKPLHLRMILIPGLTDTAENIDGVIQLARQCEFAGPVDIMPYHKMARNKYNGMGLNYMSNFHTPDLTQINAVRNKLEKNGLTVTVQ
jgi:pyruvate formate lyase activating enzyme